jgi:uncharacterized LabA/DUF88 family protein
LATKYMFIDGAYLEAAYRDVMQKVFRDAGDLDYAKVRGQSGAARTFYYNATETKLAAESKEQFEARLAAQQEKFDALSDIPTFHVRAGVMAGDKNRRRRQKEVDVQLTVDMLTHGIRGNFAEAKLLAGDRDFRPLVEAAVSLGIRVEVLYERESASKELYRAADKGTRLDVTEFWNWSSDEWTRHRVMLGRRTEHASNGAPYIEAGRAVVGRQDVIAYKDGSSGQFQFFMMFAQRDSHHVITHPDPELIQRYIAYEFGPIVWSKGLDPTA